MSKAVDAKLNRPLPVQVSDLKKSLGTKRRMNPMWYGIFPIVVAATGVALFNPSLINSGHAVSETIAVQVVDTSAPMMAQPSFGSELFVEKDDISDANWGTQPDVEVSLVALPAATADAPLSSSLDNLLSNITVATYDIDTPSNTVQAAPARVVADVLSDSVPSTETAVKPARVDPDLSAILVDVSDDAPAGTCLDVYKATLSSLVVQFDGLTAEMPAAEQVRLQRLVRTLPTCKDAIIEISGFAPGRGGDPKLSWSRAEAVLDVFTAQGANPLQFRLQQGSSQENSITPRHRVEFAVREMTSVETATAGLVD